MEAQDITKFQVTLTRFPRVAIWNFNPDSNRCTLDLRFPNQAGYAVDRHPLRFPLLPIESRVNE
eukprot:CAMPEP_0113933988 /NCGR_PEP_ID=MMETSP1339-20121228/1338_1 /TAXON_ID=94617 /ORGANISM="Fibrocapsa japonica" /LENGTH=63 /DNA_ID=CAMNT_0000935585 /DNA_START=416 /DNA_END=607 /DNA_ORIENTATION=+ /assembly_acc=CAM_ASM_000762